MTIKTQVVDGAARIITKVIDGETRVSCECCSTACCPYRVSQLGIGYLDQDLPDDLSIQDFGGFNDQITPPQNATRTGLVYETAPIPVVVSGTTVNTTFTVAYDEFGLFGPDWSGQQCLFYVLPESPTNYSNTVWRDNYLDTYEVSTSGGSFEIDRVSLCSWSGFDPDYNGGTTVILKINEASATRPRANLWTMAGIGRTDGGPYQGPPGTYSNGTYTWTVTEP
jgi:hypothetical protein